MGCRKLVVVSLLALMVGEPVYGSTLNYGKDVLLCGSVGSGSYWSGYPYMKKGWMEYLKMHLNRPVDIAESRDAFKPAHHHLTIIGLRVSNPLVARSLRARVGKVACVRGTLQPILAGRWAARVPKVFLTVTAIRSPQA